MASRSKSIEAVEFGVIRALGQTCEAINGWLADSVNSVQRDRAMLTTAHKFSDAIEHIAQYALAGNPAPFRTRCLRDDISELAGFLTEHRRVIRERFPWTLPSDDDVARLLSAVDEAEAVFGRSEPGAC